MLDLRRMAVLHQFSVSGSITATAEALGYSASAISQQLTALERETGAVLLERTARSATLTDAGRLLARHARTLLADSEQAEADLAALLGRVSGYLHITTIPSLAAPVASALATVQREHPDLEIVMRQTTDRTRRGQRRRPPQRHRGRRRLVGPRLAATGGPEEAQGVHRGGRPRGPADHPLAGLHRPLTAQGVQRRGGRDDLAVYAGGPGLAQWPATSGWARRRRHPRRRWEFEGLRTIAELVADGSGCALLPETVAATQPPGRLHALRLTPSMNRHVHLLTRASTGASPTYRRQRRGHHRAAAGRRGRRHSSPTD